MGNSNCKRCFIRETEKQSEILLSGSEELKPNLENSNQTLKNIPEEEPNEHIKMTLENNDNNSNDKGKDNNPNNNQNKNDNNDVNNDILNANREEINYDYFDEDSSFMNDDKIQSRKNVIQQYKKNKSNSN